MPAVDVAAGNAALAAITNDSKEECKWQSSRCCSRTKRMGRYRAEDSHKEELIAHLLHAHPSWGNVTEIASFSE